MTPLPRSLHFVLRAVRLDRLERVEPADDALADLLAGHRRHVVALVVNGEVVEALLVADVHRVDAFLDDDREFVAEGRVVGAARRDGQRHAGGCGRPRAASLRR